jgi:hypothetical protein
MSEARLELVVECEHGEFGFHRIGEWYQCDGGPRRVLSVPTDQMIEAAAQTIDDEIGGDIAPTLRKWPNLVHDVARAALTAAFNTLGIQETAK